METLGRTWRLYAQSFVVLTADGEVLLFPVLSAISALLLAAGVFIPLYRDGTLAALKSGGARWDGYLMLFAWYYLQSFVAIFFNSALVGCANIRLSGGDPTVADGLRIACHRAGRIAAWAFISATVGLVLRTLSGRRNRPWSFIGWALGVSWTLVTCLIVPVIILENAGVLGSIARAGELFQKRWGEQVTGTFGFGFLNLLLCLPAFFIFALLYRFDAGAALIVAGVYLLFLAAISSAVKGIFTVALYRYAAGGTPPFGFTAESMQPAAS